MGWVGAERAAVEAEVLLGAALVVLEFRVVQAAEGWHTFAAWSIRHPTAGGKEEGWGVGGDSRDLWWQLQTS